MELYIRVDSRMGFIMMLECSNGKMEMSMMADGKRVEWKDLEFLRGMMDLL